MFGFGKVRLVDPRAAQPLSAPCVAGVGPVGERERGWRVHVAVRAMHEMNGRPQTEPMGSAFFHAHVQPCRARPMSAAH